MVRDEDWKIMQLRGLRQHSFRRFQQILQKLRRRQKFKIPLQPKPFQNNYSVSSSNDK